MNIRLYEVSLTMTPTGNDEDAAERKFVAVGVDETDAMERVKQYYLAHPQWTGTILRASAVAHRFADFVVVMGEVF